MQITFNPDGTAEHIGDQICPLVQGNVTKRRASFVEPAGYWLCVAFQALRLLETVAVALEFHWAAEEPLHAWTRRWGCQWRVRVVGGPVLPGVWDDREEAIRAEVRWLEVNRL